MKKIEIIWRELLSQAIEKGNFNFVQKDLANKFDFSTSTIFQALKTPRKMGAVRVQGRFFSIEDAEKILYHWASVRDLEGEIVFSGHVDLPVFEIEGAMPAEVVFGGYSAARLILEPQTPPADYDKVFVYTKNPEAVKKRFNLDRGRANLFILKADDFLTGYGGKTTLAQTFVDIWNMNDWYAKEFTEALKAKIDGLLP